MNPLGIFSKKEKVEKLKDSKVQVDNMHGISEESKMPGAHKEIYTEKKEEETFQGKPLSQINADEELKKDLDEIEKIEKNLTPRQRQQLAKLQLKYRMKYGTPIICLLCKNPGSNKKVGPLRKYKDGYVHENCFRAKFGT